MAAVLCIDFDDTVVEQDIAAQILERFAASGWRTLRADMAAGRLSLEQYSAAALDMVEAEAGELVAFALSEARPRPGFLELLDWAHWNDWLPVVLSNGWDLYIDPILDQMGVTRVVRHCGRARFTYRWRLRYLSPRGIEVADGFKLSYVASYRDQGDFVAYVGDGRSDVAPARISQAVFARDLLLETLADEHPQLHRFETFHDVVAILDRDASTWLKSFSSTTAAEA
jgi:2-hydroxy-3-keto-5-methylthiopentenyl-1-phosphate phosphatase